MNFNYFTRSGKFENLKKGVGSMVEEQVFLKGDWPLSYLVFARLIIFAFKNCFTLCKIVLYIWKKIVVLCHHNFMKKSHSELSVGMCKEDWCVQLGQEDGCLREGGWNCLKYFKRGWNRKEGRGTKILRSGGKLSQGMGTLKKRDWNLLTNYDNVLKKLLWLPVRSGLLKFMYFIN